MPNEIIKIKIINLVKNILHNSGALLVGFGVAILGITLDSFLGLGGFRSLFTTVAGCLLLAAGLLLRMWATSLFYEQQMRVISFEPQKVLFTSGPYRFSRNPLYLGGNIFIFFGAALFLGSPGAIILTVINIFIVDVMIRREEKQLARKFPQEWEPYQKKVRRWI